MCTITHVVHVTLCLCCDVMLRLHVFVVRVHAYCVVTGCTRMIRMMCCVSGVKRMVWYTAHGACVHYVCCACGMVCTCAVRVCATRVSAASTNLPTRGWRNCGLCSRARLMLMIKAVSEFRYGFFVWRVDKRSTVRKAKPR